MIKRNGRQRNVAVTWGCLWLMTTVLGLTSCVGARQGGQLSVSPDDALDAIAAIVVGSPVHSTNYIENSQMGGGQVVVGERYFSALGVPCQRALFINPGGREHALAVCAEKNGEWATAPDIFVASRPGAAVN